MPQPEQYPVHRFLMRNCRAIIPLLLLAAISSQGCDQIVNTIGEELPDPPPVDNPIDPDPDNPSFVPPNSEIISPTTGTTLTTPGVTVTWSGNQGVVAFQDSLSGGSWSYWSSATSRVLEHLEDGSYAFYVRAAYDTSIAALIEATPDSVEFTVDAVQGTSLKFSPLYLEGSTSDFFDLDIVAEDVSNVMLVKAVVTFNPNLVTVEDWIDGDFLTSNGGYLLPYYDLDNVSGRLEINLSIVEANPAGVSGTGILTTIRFRGEGTGDADIDFESANTLMRNPANQNITIQNLVGALIRIR